MADEAQMTIPPSTATESSTTVEDGNPSPGGAFSTSAVSETSNHAGDHETDSPETIQAIIGESSNRQSDNNAFWAEMRDSLSGLRRDFESKLMYDAGKQRQLDVLHEELETYRRGFHFQMLRPIIVDLITLYGDMDKVTMRLAVQEAHTEAAREVAQFRDQIEEILRRNGVERYTSQSDMFDAGRQRAISVVETTDPANDKRIAERLRPGFEYEGKIIVQAEQVKTYRYVPTPTPEQV